MMTRPDWFRRALGAIALALSLPLSLPLAAAAGEPVRPALWKVADEDTTIWLFGTIHILPEEVDWYAGPIASAFEASSELVTEVPIDKAPEAQAQIMEKGRREDGQTLRDSLNKRQRAAYEAGMATIGLPPQAFDGNDAWFAGLMLTLIPLQAGGYNLESGVDTRIGQRAQERGMTNAALETAEYQIGLFDTLPEKTQRRYLGDVVKALPTVRQDIDTMVNAWKAGEADELARLMTETEDDPLLRKVLLTNRNRAWAKWLKDRLDAPGTVFVAVGAGHLAGKGSVQDQLARIGVRSVRVQ